MTTPLLIAWIVIWALMAVCIALFWRDARKAKKQSNDIKKECTPEPFVGEWRGVYINRITSEDVKPYCTPETWRQLQRELSDLGDKGALNE